MTFSSPLTPTHLDVRDIPARDKHASIFRVWSALNVGESFILINDHDPVPLYYQFAAQFPDGFDWHYVERGPEVFQVRITRLSDTAPKAAPVAARDCRAAPVAHGPVEVDARGLEPPEPLLRILNTVEELRAGATLHARTDRRPLHLFPELDARGLIHRCDQLVDGSWLTAIQRPS